MASQFVLPFSKLSKKNVPQAGGKGANLGELTGLKINVPPGFVVAAAAFDRFLEETDINVEIDAGLDSLNHNDLSSVDHFSDVIRSLIAKAKFPDDLKKAITQEYRKLNAPYVAVRSSATAEDSDVASWAGELETFLFINQKNLVATIQKCWSSLFTQRAIFYRFEKKLHTTQVSVAVVIQKMVISEKSGVCFTVHPVTRDKNQMVIEAGLGLGEAIVSGMITPDTYVLDKQDKTILDINISRQTRQIIRKPGFGTTTVPVKKTKQEIQVLSGQQMLELAQICMDIEKHYGKPQDIEWALEKNKFYITQTRPITTL